MTPTPRLVPDRPSDELLPCPFCGAAPMIGAWEGMRAAGEVDATHIECGSDLYDCPTNPGHSAYTRAEAIKAWNTRAAAPPAEASAHPSRAEPVAWPKGWSAADWAAWLRDRGESFDPHVQGPLFEALAAHIETMLAVHPSRGVVDEASE